MIHSISGTVIACTPPTVLLDVTSLVLTLLVPRSNLLESHSKTTLLTTLVWNQETGPSLYGFLSEQERALFLLCTNCPGIGPKMALSLLAEIDDHTLVHAVQQENTKIVSSVSGIGPKKAEHLILYLKHKMSSFLATFPAFFHASKDSSYWQTAHLALESLNYTKQEISAAFHYVRHQNASPANVQVTFDTIMRQALVFLAKQR